MNPSLAVPGELPADGGTSLTEQATVLSVHVGVPRTRKTADGTSWRSAIFKETVGQAYASRSGLAGDRQANLRFHGGPDKAICCHASEHYPRWQQLVGQPIPPGGFGENLTTRGWSEDMACIGDVVRIGAALVEVSQPRVPCINVARRWESPELLAEVARLGFAGFYLRVLEEGDVTAGDAILLQKRRHPRFSVLRVNEILFGDGRSDEALLELIGLDELAGEIKNRASRLLTR